MPELRTDTKELRKLMIDADLNQAELAKKSGISIPTLSAIMSGTSKPNLNTIQKLAWALGKPINEVCQLFINEKRSD